MTEVKICPKCGGLQPGCEICNAPPKREFPANIGGTEVLNLHYPLPEGIRISQVFGANPAWYPTSKGHNGIDWGCVVGTEIYAMREGEVIRADATDEKKGYGRHVRIQHLDGISIYGHLSQIFCKVGDLVKSGQLIGLSGGDVTDPYSGWSTGPHLHGEYRLTNVANPVPGGYVYNAINILPLLTNAVDWEVQGVDLSVWNGDMDLSITKKRAQYLDIRLGYGNGWKDAKCDNYRQQAIDNDMPYFGYWFNNIGENVDDHVNGFAKVAAEKPGIIGLEGDYERTVLDRDGTLSWIKVFDSKLNTIQTLPTSAYSSWNFWANYVAINTYFVKEQWVANWTSAPVPYMPPGWTWQKGCKWQWSADGNGLAKLYGMLQNGDVDMDLNRYYGTCEDFNVRYNRHIFPLGEIPNEPPQGLPDYVYPNGLYGYLNIRSTPNPYGDIYIIGRANNGKKWKPIAKVIGTDGKEYWKINEFAYMAKWLTRW